LIIESVLEIDKQPDSIMITTEALEVLLEESNKKIKAGSILLNK